jgi:hypothetical protein
MLGASKRIGGTGGSGSMFEQPMFERPVSEIQTMPEPQKYGRARGTKDDAVQKGSNRGQPALAAAHQEVRTGQPGRVLTVSEHRI